MRLGFKIVLYFFLLNISANILVAAGVGADLGIEWHPGAEKTFEKAEKKMSNLSPSNLGLSTLIGVFLVIAGTLEVVFEVLLAGPYILARMPLVPAWLTLPFTAVAVLLAGRELVYTVSGGIDI